jgi:Txe/YoeB family toxin of Txe-Axe toxin-antitoxin module
MSVRRSWEVWAYLDEVDDARHPVVPLFVAHVRRAAQVAAVGPDTTCNTICPSGCTGCSRHESRVRRKRNELPVNDFELWLSFDRKMARRITRLIGRFSVIRSAGSENQSPPRENCRSRRIDDEHRLSCTEQTIAKSRSSWRGIATDGSSGVSSGSSLLRCRKALCSDCSANQRQQSPKPQHRSRP